MNKIEFVWEIENGKVVENVENDNLLRALSHSPYIIFNANALYNSSTDCLPDEFEQSHSSHQCFAICIICGYISIRNNVSSSDLLSRPKRYCPKCRTNTIALPIRA